MSILLLRKKPGVFDTLVILNLHFMIGIPTFLHGSQATIAVEDGSAYAVAHLAIARTQNAGNGIVVSLLFNSAIKRTMYRTTLSFFAVNYYEAFGF